MTKFTTIPQGYRITVESTENDGDNDRSESLSGLNKSDTQFYVALLRALKRGYDCDNLYDPSEEEMQTVVDTALPVYEQYRDLISPSIKEYFEEDGVLIQEDQFSAIADLLGKFGLQGGEFVIRSIDGILVEWIPEEIKIQDVTGEFQ